MTSKAAFAFVCLLALMTSGSAFAAGFKCPDLSDLRSSPAAEAVTALLPNSAALADPRQMASAITLLKEHGLSNDDTINHLMALYCPTVAARGDLPDDSKLADVRKFARQVTAQVLSTNTEDSVLFKVPLSPANAEAAKESAAAAGLTIEQWIAQSVNAALRTAHP